MLGLLVFWPIVYKSLWDTFVFRFELYENLSFLSSLEVLLKTTDPYLWISDSKWRIFLTCLGTFSNWSDFLPFRKNPQSTYSIFSIFVLGFIPIFVLDEFHPKSEMILHQLVIGACLILFGVVSDFRLPLFAFWFSLFGSRTSLMWALKNFWRKVIVVPLSMWLIIRDHDKKWGNGGWVSESVEDNKVDCKN